MTFLIIVNILVINVFVGVFMNGCHWNIINLEFIILQKCKIQKNAKYKKMQQILKKILKKIIKKNKKIKCIENYS